MLFLLLNSWLYNHTDTNLSVFHYTVIHTTFPSLGFALVVDGMHCRLINATVLNAAVITLYWGRGGRKGPVLGLLWWSLISCILGGCLVCRAGWDCAQTSSPPSLLYLTSGLGWSLGVRS